MTTEHLARFAKAMRNARKRLELEQEEPLDLDQICTFHGICKAMDIEPGAVLDKEALNLIEPGPPLIEVLAEEPGRAL